MALINSKLKFPFADSAYTVRTIQGDESTTKTLLSLSGMYDPWIIRILEQYIHEDFVCFDVGANIGIVSIAMSLLASRGRVFAFEASKRNFDLLNENLQLNNITNVEALNLAIYDQNGEVAFEHVDEFAAGSYISETEVHDHRAQITSVQCVRLTDWCRSRSDLTRIDFIKMDIEGSEIKALQGSAEILNQYKPLVLVEFNAHTLKTFQGESMLSLYNVARGIFQHIYLVDNSTGDLYPVHSREEFNRLMTERNRQIEDFLCSFTNLHPPERKKWFWFWRS